MKETREGEFVFHYYNDKDSCLSYMSTYVVAGWRYHDNLNAFSIRLIKKPSVHTASGWVSQQ